MFKNRSSRHDAIQKGRLRAKGHFADVWWNARNGTDPPTFTDCLIVAVDLNGYCYCIVTWDESQKIGYDEILEKGSTRIRIKEEVPKRLLMEVAEAMRKGELTLQEIKDEYLSIDKYDSDILEKLAEEP